LFKEAYMSINSVLVFCIATILFISACGINSVSKAQLENVKAGDVITYRYRKGDKEWFYADHIVRVDGDTIYYNASKNESTKGNDHRLRDFETTKELSMKKADLLKYETEQGEEQKKIIWIE
jgi:hypothetical protein